MRPAADPGMVEGLAARLAESGRRRLGRRLALWHLDTGGCNGCEVELRQFEGMLAELAGHGLFFADTPLHADVLLATGPVCRAMAGPLARCLEAMPEPRWVVALGDCAIDGGLFKGPATLGGIGNVLPVDVIIRGCPPTPAQILAALLALVEANGPARRRSG